MVELEGLPVLDPNWTLIGRISELGIDIRRPEVLTA
jgi:hypothetical protein